MRIWIIDAIEFKLPLGKFGEKSMAMSKLVKNITKEDWRSLGYYFECDDINKKWIFVGSKNGLGYFNLYLEQYIHNPKNKAYSEHDHLGPYQNLRILTNAEAKITDSCISGTLDDFDRLKNLIKAKLVEAEINSKFIIDEEFSSYNDYILEFKIMDYGFDPATADKQLWE